MSDNQYSDIEDAARRLLEAEERQEKSDEMDYRSDESVRDMLQQFQQAQRDSDPFGTLNRLAEADDALQRLADAEPNVDEFPWSGVDTEETGASIIQNATGKSIGQAGPLGGRTPKRIPPLFDYLRIRAWEHYDDGDVDPTKIFTVMGYKGSLSSSSSSSSPSSKNAITRVKDRWIGWICSEQPEPIFSDTLEVKMNRSEEFCLLKPKFLSSVYPDSIFVDSAMPDTPCRVAANTFMLSDEPQLRVAVKTGFLQKKPSKVTIRISGVRRSGHSRWQRFPKAIMELNNAFWSQAHS